jgi:integrase
MKMIELIRHYDRRIGEQRELSPSLASKVLQLMEVFGQLPHDAAGAAIEKVAIARWPKSASTRRRMLVQLRAVLHVANDDGVLDAVPKLRLPFVHDVREAEITWEEANSLLDTLKWGEPRFYPLALVLCHTGARLSEALRIDPAKDFTERGTVLHKPVARRTKTVRRLIPYTPRMRVELPSLTKMKTLAPVGQGDEKAKSVSALMGRVVSETCVALGLPHTRVHDLRHVFAGAVGQFGGDLADIASLCGHENVAMVMRYRGLVRSRAEGILDRAQA